MKKFLVVVDTQYDFVMPDGALYVPGAEEIILPGIQFLAGLKPEDYAGVLFTADTHLRETYFDLPESKEFPIHCVKDERGWANVFNSQLVNRDINQHFLEKGVFSMWEEPDLHFKTGWQENRDDFFNNLARKKINIIQVMGVASDYCVKWAVDGFVKRGFQVEVIQELCRGIAQPAGDVFDAPEYNHAVQLI